MNSQPRLIKEEELVQLLSLYEYLIPEDPKLEIDSNLKNHWKDILADPNLYYLVIEDGGKIVSSCTMAIIKNLTRSARPYALIENVVTHPDYRKKGYGTKILKKALGIAKSENCYKVMLLTSHKDDETLRFYENAGFNQKEKTGFIVRL
ncbi:MAG: GNAT family N-acetyltransferase [Methanobacteriaceae archaeon]|nr:GNAT family N-acetyltransferase [Methanobacteriaceae archaeon]